MPTHSKPETVAPFLASCKVLEWGNGVACAYAAKLLADLGAQATRAPEVAESSRAAPPEVLVWLDCRKRTCSTANLVEAVASADVLITDLEVEELERNLGVVSLRETHPQLVIACITPFGLTGPYRHFRGGDLEIAFLSGLAYLTPRDIAKPQEGPLPPPSKDAGVACLDLRGCQRRGRRSLWTRSA